MGHITLSVSDDVLAEMRKHRKIKWSEVVRISIAHELEQLHYSEGGIISGEELYGSLKPEVREMLDRIPERKMVMLQKEVLRREKKRLKYLTRTS
ncbi:MAG TPA: hypothetical protein VGQ00_00980 [Candidatus Norongarragalinales archaeon]|jgi:hypothetical protein|nr:hypothetical protein [Candidatus Norongarragalinales archaeon]